MHCIPPMQECKARKDLCCVIPKNCLPKCTIFLKQLMDRAPRNILEIDRECLIALHCSIKHINMTVVSMLNFKAVIAPLMSVMMDYYVITGDQC